MKYIIDTDILIYFLKNVPNTVAKFDEIDPDLLATTMVNYAELLFGAYNSTRIDDNLSKIRLFLKTLAIIDFDKDAAEKFARLKTDLRKGGNIIPDMDLMIASICLAKNAILVTNNTKHFQRLKDLRTENWA